MLPKLKTIHEIDDLLISWQTTCGKIGTGFELFAAILNPQVLCSVFSETFVIYKTTRPQYNCQSSF